MDEVTIRRAEAIIDFGAAAALGAAVAWLGVQLAFEPLAAAAAGLVGLAGAVAALRYVCPEAISFRLAGFDLCDLEPAELHLTSADRAEAVAIDCRPESHELVLDDALAPAKPESRVVRLFDVSAMPTPDELKARFDRHLSGPQPASPDATRALFDALAELRSSLR